MELKHKECFIPNMINYWDLQGVSKYAREAAEFVNLYSKSRGINRFPALVETLEWTATRGRRSRPGACRSTSRQSLLDWIAAGDEAGQSGAWKRPWQRDGRPGPEAYAGMVEGGEPRDRGDGPRRAAVPLRPRVPGEARRARPTCWSSPPRRTRPCSGNGTSTTWPSTSWPSAARKSARRRNACEPRQKYPPGHTLMIGDAPGDHKAAAANHALFFPINPGAEEAQLEAVLRRGDRPLLRRHVRRQVPGGAAGRVRPLPARSAAVAGGKSPNARETTGVGGRAEVA